jgi:hypothetical protein
MSTGTAYEMTVWPPDVTVIGPRCETCGHAQWESGHALPGSPGDEHSVHCGCCPHPHPLEPGVHVSAPGCPAALI